jgi:hypothetical protein
MSSNKFDEQGSGMTGWLLCRLDSGMFSDEVAVTYPAASSNHWQKSVFVPRTFVRSASEHQGEVKVRVVVKDGARYAVLPSPRGDIVRIEGADLKQQ